MHLKKTATVFLALAIGSVLLPSLPSRAQDNKIMGQIEFDATNKPEKNAGVWIDGQYLGFVNELRGDKKVLLLPGEHDLVVRQTGYQDFEEKITLEPGKVSIVKVQLSRDPKAQYSTVNAQVKIHVEPDRAAVFVDGNFAGYVHQFGGVGRAMLVSPGKHEIKIALPGFRDFTTQLNLLPKQKYTIETKLLPGSITQADPAVKQN
jgi:PEGA domain